MEVLLSRDLQVLKLEAALIANKVAENLGFERPRHEKAEDEQLFELGWHAKHLNQDWLCGDIFDIIIPVTMVDNVYEE